MRLLNAVFVATVLVLMFPLISLAQSVQPSPAVSIPRLVNISGVFQPVDGQPPAPVEAVTLSIYSAPEGGALLWQETQVVPFDKAGRFTVLMGATQADGIPPEVFASGQAHWMSMQVARVGEVEQPRVRIASVPYALRASDAETLGGLPASAYLLAPTAGESDPRAASAGSVKAASGTTVASSGGTADLVLPGTTNFLAKYVNSADVGNSAVFETGGSVGIGTTTPVDTLHLRFTNTGGSATGLAVQNLGNTTASYSGMLFYDQFGALGQFQGFNNVTHEYRINNIATSGSINFMLAGTSRFFAGSNGNVGIGTTSPSTVLEVSNALSFTGGTGDINATSFSPLGTAPGSAFLGRKARGTSAAPTALLAGDQLAFFGGKGYGATGFGPSLQGTGGMSVVAAQNFTDTQQGTAVTFTTTSIDATFPTTRMTLDATGNLGIGTTTVPAAALLEVSNASNVNTTGTLVATTFANAANSVMIGSRARGTSGAPAAVQNGDALVGFLGRGYGGTNFSGTRGGMFVRAAENWTNTAQGTALNFNTTAIGTNTPGTKMTIDPAGNIGIGTQTPGYSLEVSRTNDPRGSTIASTAYGQDSGSFFIAQTARGTAAAPTAVQTGDFLGGFGMSGYGTTSFNDIFAAVAGVAAENFTDTARGTSLVLGTTPLGTHDINLVIGLLPSGNVGIGTPADVNGVPTATDRLQVFGDVRVGNANTNGCLRNFAGTGIAGTCVSDRRFKKDITPFGPALGALTALQPVHYNWRAADFPEQHFGDSRAYGLIAQDVEQVLPELVVTNDDGFKAVDYSQLPLLTIQAVKELQAENEALKAGNEELKAGSEALKQRVGELERLVREMLATAASR